MRRKYEAYIDGKPFIIAENAEPRDAPDGYAFTRVASRAKVRGVVRALEARKGPRGAIVVGADSDQVWEWFRSGYRFVPAAGGCVTDERGRLLAIHRLGVWDLPKGKVDADERVEAAALREVREECGLKKVEIVRRLRETWHTYKRRGEPHLKRTDWYLMRSRSTEKLIAQSAEKITDVRWMNAAGVEEMKASVYPSLLGVIAAWERALRRQA